MDIHETIAWAKKTMEADPHLANYGLRDTQEIKDAGLSDLAWTTHQDGYVTKNDVLYVIEKLEEYLEKP